MTDELKTSLEIAMARSRETTLAGSGFEPASAGGYDAGLEAFLHLLDPQLPLPAVVVDRKRVDLCLEKGDVREVPIVITNPGRGYLSGTIEVSESIEGLQFSSYLFGVDSKDTAGARVVLTIATSGLPSGETYKTSIVITTNGELPVVTIPVSVFVAAEPRGNSVGNLANSGLAALQDDWVYCCLENKGIFKWRLDGSGKVKLNNDDASDLNVLGGWIFYRYRYNDNNWIYRMRTDGSVRIKLTGDKTYSLNVVGNWIYYVKSDDRSIYKMRLDGSGKIKLADDKTYGLYVAGDWIYHKGAYGSDGIYKMRLDGSGEVKLADDEVWNLNIADGWVYYRNFKDDRTYKMRTDGSGKIKLTDDKIYGLNVVGNWIYYVKGDDLSIYKMRTDGGGSLRLNRRPSSNIQIVGDWVYYRGKNIWGKWGPTFKMRTNGRDHQRV